MYNHTNYNCEESQPLGMMSFIDADGEDENKGV